MYIIMYSIYIKLMKINIYLCEVVVLDHVYFVHPSTDISVDTSVECQSMLDRYVGQHVDRHSADISIKMCQSTY